MFINNWININIFIKLNTALKNEQIITVFIHMNGSHKHNIERNGRGNTVLSCRPFSLLFSPRSWHLLRGKEEKKLGTIKCFRIDLKEWNGSLLNTPEIFSCCFLPDFKAATSHGHSGLHLYSIVSTEGTQHSCWKYGLRNLPPNLILPEFVWLWASSSPSHSPSFHICIMEILKKNVHIFEL